MKNSEVYKAEVTYLERDHFSVLLGSPTKELSLNILVSHVPHGGRMSQMIISLGEGQGIWVPPLSPSFTQRSITGHTYSALLLLAPSVRLGSAPWGGLQLCHCASGWVSGINLSFSKLSICRVMVPAHLSSALKSSFYQFNNKMIF